MPASTLEICPAGAASNYLGTAPPTLPLRSGARGIGAWEPLWLQQGMERRLYAALHRPVADASPLAVLLASPLLFEQPRSRRFVAEVASGLADLGLTCLRFDFHGTGDSAGTGEDTDFESMGVDLAIAMDALRARTGIRRVVVLAWRGAALPLWRWMIARGSPDMVALWEPIVDGRAWLAELEAWDAVERQSQHRYPLRRQYVPACNDGQLLGLPVSQRLREDLNRAKLGLGEIGRQCPVWVVERANAAPLPLEVARRFVLPEDAPALGGGVRMDARLCVNASLGRVVSELGNAMLAMA